VNSCCSIHSKAFNYFTWHITLIVLFTVRGLFIHFERKRDFFWIDITNTWKYISLLNFSTAIKSLLIEPEGHRWLPPRLPLSRQNSMSRGFSRSQSLHLTKIELAATWCSNSAQGELELETRSIFRIFVFVQGKKNIETNSNTAR